MTFSSLVCGNYFTLSRYLHIKGWTVDNSNVKWNFWKWTSAECNALWLQPWKIWCTQCSWDITWNDMLYVRHLFSTFRWLHGNLHVVFWFQVIDQNNGMYRCEKCNREYPNFKYRLLLSVSNEFQDILYFAYIMVSTVLHTSLDWFHYSILCITFLNCTASQLRAQQILEAKLLWHL